VGRTVEVVYAAVSGYASEFGTIGEQLVGRTLEKEKRAGVTHFKPGQHRARVYERDGDVIGELSYVDQMGHAVLVVCVWDEGAWHPVGGLAAGQTSAHGI